MIVRDLNVESNSSGFNNRHLNNTQGHATQHEYPHEFPEDGEFEGDLSIGANLNVDGHTSLNTLNVSGVSTYSSLLNLPDTGLRFTNNVGVQIQNNGGQLQLKTATIDRVLVNNDGSVDFIYPVTMEDDLTVDGNMDMKADATVGGQLIVDNGTEALPSITTTGDLDTGIFFPAANQISLTNNGDEGFFLGTVNCFIRRDLNVEGKTLLADEGISFTNNPGVSIQNNAGEMKFRTALNDRMTIDAAGDVNILNDLNLTGQGFFQDGSAAAPAIAPTSDTDTGIYFDAGEVNVTSGGTRVGRFDGDGFFAVGSSVGGLFYKTVVAQVSTTSTLGLHRVNYVTGAGAIDLTLPDLSVVGSGYFKTIIIDDSATGNKSLYCDGSDTFSNGASVRVMTAGDRITIVGVTLSGPSYVWSYVNID